MARSDKDGVIATSAATFFRQHRLFRVGEPKSSMLKVKGVQTGVHVYPVGNVIADKAICANLTDSVARRAKVDLEFEGRSSSCAMPNIASRME